MVQDLLNKMWSYLNSRITLQDLEAWVLSNLQGILDSGDKTAIHVANQVDADLVELGEGLIDEATLRERFESYIEIAETITFTSQDAEPRDSIHLAAAAETIMRRSEVLGPVVDVRLRHEFA